jgi:hypothetical protein
MNRNYLWRVGMTENSRSLDKKHVYVSIGSVTGMISYVVGTILSYFGFKYYYFSFLGKPDYSNIDEFMIIYFCWVPVVVVSGLLGGIGGKYVERRSLNSRFSLLCAVLGGIVGGLLVAFLMTGNIISGWASYYD